MDDQCTFILTSLDIVSFFFVSNIVLVQPCTNIISFGLNNFSFRVLVWTVPS